MSDDIQLFTTQSLDNNNLPEDKKPPADDPDTIVFPEGSFSTPPQPTVASGFRAANIMTGNQTLPFRDDVETYTKYGVPLGNFDWEEIRARNQSTAEQWGRGIAKAAVTYGTAVAENTLGFAAGLGNLAMGGTYQDNYVGKMVDNANEWMRENYANYYTREQQKNTDVFSANFWADSVFSGLAYSLASLTTMYLTGGTGYVSLASKALSTAAKGRNAYRLAKAVTTGTKLANILDKGSKVGTRTLNAAKMYEAGLMMALAESSVEARETRRQVIDDLKQQYINENGGTLSDIPTDVLNDIEDLATSAGNTDFVINLAITGGTNAFMFGAMASGFKNSMRSLRGMHFDKNSKKVIDSFAKQSPKRKTVNRVVNYLKNPAIEIVQEGSQYASNVYSSDIASQKFMDSGAIDRIQALERSLTETFGDKEGRESMLVGGIVGAIMGLRTVKGQRAREEQEQEYRDKVRRDLQNIYDGGYFDLGVEKAHRDAQATATAKKMQEALEQSGLKKFKDLQAEFIQNRVVDAIQNGGYDVLIEQLEDSKYLSDEEFMKHYGFPTEPSEGTSRKIPYELGELLQVEQTKESFVNRIIGKVENVKKVYDNVNDLFPIPALTKGLPRLAMSAEQREAEAKARQARINLRNELFLNGYAINDKTRRMDSIMEQVENLLSDDPILKSLGADMSALVQEIKNIEPVRFSEETPSMQQALEERESKLTAAFNALLNEVGKSNQGIAVKIKPLAKDYLNLSFDNAVALDRYNKLISDPYFRANFQAETKQKEDAATEQTRKNHVDEVLSESENSADLEKNRPNAETLSESEKTALRERQRELEHEERQAKNKYQKLVEGMTDEEALKHLKTINQKELTGPEKVGLRNAKIAIKMRIDSEKANLAPESEAERAARAVFTGDQQMQGESELSEEASEIAIQGSADGREFEINGTRYVNDLENIQDAIRVGDDNTVSSVTLKDAQTKNPATFTGKPALAIAHAIYAAEVGTIESPDQDFILPEVAQARINEISNYLKEWKEEAAFKDEESGRNRLPQSKPTQLLTEQTIELEALKSFINSSLSQLKVHLIQNSNFTAEDLDADLNVKSLTKAYRSVSTLAGRRRKELNKRPDREEVQDAAVESLLSELDDIKEQFPYVLSGRTGSLTNIIQELYGKDESTETGEQTESRDPSELEGQAPRRESIDPEEYTEGQETLEVTPDQPVSTAEEIKHTEFEEPGMPTYTGEQMQFNFNEEEVELIDEDEFFGTETESTEDDTEDYFNIGPNTIQENVLSEVAKIKKYDVFVAPDGNTGYIGKGVKEDGSVPLLDGTGSIIGYYKFNDLWNRESIQNLEKKLNQPTQASEVDLGTETAPKGGKVVISATKGKKPQPGAVVAFRTKGKTEQNMIDALKDNAVGNPFGPHAAIVVPATGVAVTRFLNWLEGTGDTNVMQKYRQALLAKAPELKGKTIYYYKDLGRPSHATALDYFLNKPTQQASEVKKGTINVYWGGKNTSKPENHPERILSNLAERKFTWEGRKYGSVEHAYQSNKSGTFDQVTYDAYNNLKEIPGQQGSGYGKKIRGKGTVAQMKKADSLGLMKKLVVESFKQNPNSEAAKILMQYENFTHNTNQLIDQAFLEGLKLAQQELESTQPTQQVSEEESFKQTFKNSLWRGQESQPIINENGELILITTYDSLFKSEGISFAENLSMAQDYGLRYSKNPFIIELDESYVNTIYPLDRKGRSKDYGKRVVGDEREQRFISKENIVIPKGKYKIHKKKLSVDLSDVKTDVLLKKYQEQFYEGDVSEYLRYGEVGRGYATEDPFVFQEVEKELLKRGVDKEDLPFLIQNPLNGLEYNVAEALNITKEFTSKSIGKKIKLPDEASVTQEDINFYLNKVKEVENKLQNKGNKDEISFEPTQLGDFTKVEGKYTFEQKTIKGGVLNQTIKNNENGSEIIKATKPDGSVRFFLIGNFEGVPNKMTGLATSQKEIDSVLSQLGVEAKKFLALEQPTQLQQPAQKIPAKLQEVLKNKDFIKLRSPREVAEGIEIIDNALTSSEELELFEMLKPFIESQGAKSNKGKSAPIMIGMGLRWDYKSNNPGKTPIKIKETIVNSQYQKNKYGYYDVSIDGEPLGEIPARLKELMTKATGVDATNYDGAIINVYQRDSFISAHNDVDESATAIKYPVIVANIGGPGSLSVEGAESQKAKKGYSSKEYVDEPLSSGSAYIFGENGKNRDVFHRTLPSSGKGNLPQLNIKGQIIPANSYRISVTLRRVKDLEPGMPTAPNKNDNSFYVNTKTGKKYTRVSKVIVKEKVKRNALLDSASLLGNKIDKLVRDIFSGNLKDLESYDIVEPSLESAVDELKFFVKEIQEIKAAMFEKRGEVAIAEDVILYDDENSVAGTVDLLTYDSKGVVRIYDVKTMRGNKFTEYYRGYTENKYQTRYEGRKSDEQKHQEQLSLYRILLNNTHGVKAKHVGIMPIMLNYDEYDVTTRTVILLPGVQHKALDNVEGIKLKDKPAAAPEESVQRPMPKAGIEGQRSYLRMMNDASFKFIDNNKYYVAVKEDGELDRYAAINPETDAPYGPVSVTEGPFDKSFPLILTPNTGKLVKAKAGAKVEFVLGDNEVWFSKELEEFGLDKVSKMTPEDYALEFSNKVPIHVYLDGEFVGRLESGNPLNNVERLNIVEELKAGKKVERSILKKVGTNPAYVRATLSDGTVKPVYSDPRTVLSTEPILVSVNHNREKPYLSSSGIIDGELSILNVDFSNLTLGTIFFAIDPSDTPNGEYNIIKGNTKTLTPGYIDGVMQLFKNKEMLKAADVVANTIAFPTLSPTFLHFNTFGKSGAPFIVFTSPSMGRMVRVNQEQLSSSIVNGKGKVSVVQYDYETDKFLVDRNAKIKPDYNVSEDLREFLKNKKFQVDIQAANTNEDFTDPVTGVYYDTYLDYLFNPMSEFSADVLGHDSKLNIDVQRIDGSLYYDLGVTFTTEEDKTGEQEIKRAVRAVKTTKSAAKNNLLNQALGQNTDAQAKKDQDEGKCTDNDPPF